MKSLILLTALIGAQAFAGTIVCNRQTDGTTNENVKTVEDADKPEVVDFLRVEGLIDSEGFLTVRRDLPTMASLISKRNGTDICRGVNVNELPENSGGSPTTGWRRSQLDSKALKIKLFRDPVSKEISATTVTDNAKLFFTNCQFYSEEGDQEALKELWDETHDPELEAKMEEDAREGRNKLPEPGIVDKTLIYMYKQFNTQSQGAK